MPRFWTSIKKRLCRQQPCGKMSSVCQQIGVVSIDCYAGRKTQDCGQHVPEYFYHYCYLKQILLNIFLDLEILLSFQSHFIFFSANNYLFKVNNIHTKKVWNMFNYNKKDRNCVITVNFGSISYLFLVPLLLTLNREMFADKYTSKYHENKKCPCHKMIWKIFLPSDEKRSIFKLKTTSSHSKNDKSTLVELKWTNLVDV